MLSGSDSTSNEEIKVCCRRSERLLQYLEDRLHVLLIRRYASRLV